MARKVFFSFHFAADAWRVGVVRNSNVVAGYDKNPFLDKADWEEVKKQGRAEVKRWIDGQLHGTSVTVVLVGSETATRPWVKYEIEQSVAHGKGLLAIDISKIKDGQQLTSDTGTNPLPTEYPWYRWHKDNGRDNLGTWIEQAAFAAGR